MNTIIKLLLLFMPLISFGQEYIIKNDTIHILKSGWYSYDGDSLILNEPSEDEKIQMAISESSNILFLMDKYIETYDTITTISYILNYQNNQNVLVLAILCEKYKLIDIKRLGDYQSRYTFSKYEPTFEGFMEWIKNK